MSGQLYRIDKNLILFHFINFLRPMHPDLFCKRNYALQIIITYLFIINNYSMQLFDWDEGLKADDCKLS